MSLDKLCKATGLTLAIVGLSVAHSSATEEQITEKQAIEKQVIEKQITEEQAVTKQAAEREIPLEGRLKDILATDLSISPQNGIDRDADR